MNNNSNEKPQPQRQTKKLVLTQIIGACAAIAAIFTLAYMLTAPPTPAEAAEQYLEDHYDTVAEAVLHTAFPDNPLKAEFIAEVAESIAEQVIPYNCHLTSNREATVDARCNLSFTLNQPLELQIHAPFRVSMSTTERDLFSRSIPVVQDSSPIISEMTVNGMNLRKFKEAEAAAKKVKKALSETGSQIEEAKETFSETESKIKDLFRK